MYHLSVQCQWSAPYQKYAGHMTSSGPAAKAFGDVLSPGAECMCAKHSVVLQGYDTDGVALTAKTEYKPKYSMLGARAKHRGHLPSIRPGGTAAIRE